MELSSQVDLLDSEVDQIYRILYVLNSKYAQRKDSKSNLVSLVHEAEELFRKLGFEITVALSRHVVQAMGGSGAGASQYLTFSIDRRLNADEFDHDRQEWERKHLDINEEFAKRFLSTGGTKHADAGVTTEEEALPEEGE